MVINMKWEENVRKVVPYVAGEQPNRPNMIKLNTNECPYPPAPGVRKAAENMESAALRLYPNSNAQPLVDELAAYYGVKPEQVFVGVGSDDVLSMAFLTFFNSGKPILFPDVTYSFYDVWADLYRIPYHTCALDENWHMNPEDYKQPNGGVIFPNPNAPTGVEESQAMIEEILQANPDVVVIVDEAYVDFGGTSALPLLKKYENLLVVQTFSKSRAMAGMRIGFCIGNEKLIHYLNDVKFSFNSYTMNLPSQVMGVEAVRDDAYFKATTAKIAATRERIKKELNELGFTFPDSKANFIFASHKEVPAEELFRALREADIYVRHWNKPRIANSLRITVGTDEEMDRLMIFLVSMVPLIELRGAVPIAVGMNLPLLPSYIICILGNMLPVPIIFFFARKVLEWGADKPVIGKFFTFCLEKGHKGGQKLQEKAGRGLFVALLLFVGIPLPGTGAWTGTLAASLLDMDFKSSVIAVMCGVVLAGVIMGLLSMGVFGALGTIF